MGTGGSFPRDRPARHEDNRSPPSSTEITTECTYTSTVLYVFMACRGIFA
jgi:hypothetical protein